MDELDEATSEALRRMGEAVDITPEEPPYPEEVEDGDGE